MWTPMSMPYRFNCHSISAAQLTPLFFSQGRLRSFPHLRCVHPPSSRLGWPSVGIQAVTCVHHRPRMYLARRSLPTRTHGFADYITDRSDRLTGITIEQLINLQFCMLKRCIHMRPYRIQQCSHGPQTITSIPGHDFPRKFEIENDDSGGPQNMINE